VISGKTRHSPTCVGSVFGFPSRAIFQGTHTIQSRGSPFPQKAKAFAKLSALSQKRRFGTRKIIAREILGKLLPANFCDFKATPPFKRFRVFSGIFSLFP